MFWRSKEVGSHIARVASSFGVQPEFSVRARASAHALGRKALGKARAYFWAPPEKPSELAGRFDGLGEWMAACQAAIFEIWFHLRDDALKDLRKVAFGPYDWTQANATEVLCRLAIEGVETAHTSEQIARALPTWRYEQIMRVCAFVAELSVRSPALRAAYEALIVNYLEGDPVDAFELIAALARFDLRAVRQRYGDFLLQLSEGTGLVGRTAFDDGHVVTGDDGKSLVAKSGPTYPLLEDFHRIRAAVLRYELFPEDERTRKRLAEWSVQHPDESVRSELAALLQRRTSASRESTR